MANKSPRRGTNKTLYLLNELREQLALTSEATSTSESAIVGEALREYFERHPVPPARRRLVEQRRAVEAKLRREVEEKGIEPRSSDRRTRRDRALRLVAA